MKNLDAEKTAWENILSDLDAEESKLQDMVKNLPIVGVGDSIMLGALDSLYKQFPNGYFDAAISRTDWEANPILVNLKNRGLLSDIIVFNLGTNGECPDSCKKEIFETIGDRQIFWVNATHPDYPIFNTNLKNLANTHKNIHIIDWISASNGHPEYFIADGIHLTSSGAPVYAKTIYEAIYNYYLNELKIKKEQKLKEHNESELNKITFIGNDILLNAYELLQSDYVSSDFMINSNYTYESLINEIENRQNENTLSHNLIFMFDNGLKLSKEKYEKIISLCKEHQIYFITTYKLPPLEYDNVTIIDFYSALKEHPEYLMADKLHLTNEGINIIKELITKTINKKNK